MCIDISKHYGDDYCWRVLSKTQGGKYTYTSTLYEDDDIEDFDNKKGGKAPAGKSADIIWEADWSSAGRHSVVLTNGDVKAYDGLITANSKKRNMKLQMYIRDLDFIGDLAGGELDVDTFMIWMSDATEELDDDEGDDIKIPKATTQELTLAGGEAGTNLNLVKGSSTLWTDCNPNSSAGSN